MGPTSCLKCKKVPRAKAVMRSCKECSKLYHNVCHTWAALPGNKFLCEDCKPKSNTSKSNTLNYNKSILTNNNIKPKEIKTALKIK